MVMVGNRVSYNGYSFTRAPTQDWGQVPPDSASAPVVNFSKVNNQTPWQAAEPLALVASNLGLRDFGFALGAFPTPGASRLGYPDDGGQRYMMLAREAIIFNIAGSTAWKYHDVFGVGATLEWIMVPRLNYSLVIDSSPFQQAANPVSSPLDMKAVTEGSDWFTFNAIIGAWYRPVPFLQFGAAAQVIPTQIKTNSTLKVTPVDPTMTEEVVLRREGFVANDVNVILPLPLSVRAGARYRGLATGFERFDVELDVEYETWSRVNNFTVDTRGLVAEFMGGSADLGQIKIAKAWRDTIAVKLGGDVAVIPGRLALRGGAFYETAVAPASHANIDFAGGAMFGGSVGGSLALGRRAELALAYQLRRQQTVTVSEADGRVYQQVPASACAMMPPYTSNVCHPQFIGQPAPVVNAGTYDATFHYLTLALLLRF